MKALQCMAYYNENDPFAAAWLRELICAGAIAPGDVDERDVRDVVPDEIAGYRQCHFFAGIGVWSYALRLAGWPDDRPVWTGSCPCQPFSAAGKRGGFADERHLWPAWHHLICQCRPARVVGEQVAGTDGFRWLDLVQADLEDADYACGAVDLCAAGIGAPHIRQRLWWTAKRLDFADGERRQQVVAALARRQQLPDGRGGAGRLADTLNEGPQGRLRGRPDTEWESLDRHAGRGGSTVGLANANSPGQRIERSARLQRPELHDADGRGPDSRPSAADGFWGSADWLHCRDGKWRPVEPGTFPLAHGAAGRVGRLRGYGNALNAEAAATFIRAAMK